MFQVTFWSIPPLIVALVGAGAYVHIQHKKRVPGMHAILVLLAAMLFWAGGQFLDTVLLDFDLKVLVNKLTYFGIVIIPVAWFVFAMTYTRRQIRISPLALNAVCLVPIATLCVIWTSQWHDLFWTELKLVEHDGYVGLAAQYGPWFYFHTVYSHVLLIVATTILAYAIAEGTGELKPVLAVIFAPVVVLLANVFYLSPWNPAPWFDMTTLGFAVSAMILDKGVLRYGLLEKTPVVRDRVVEKLTDGVVVINSQGTIIDFNTSAQGILGGERRKFFNHAITEFVTTVPLEAFTAHFDKTIEVTLAARGYEVASSMLDARDANSDIVLVFRDVTTRRKTERDLRDIQDELTRQAHTDSLTGLHNRRFFMQRLAEEIERVRRHGSSLSVLIFDIDNFKQVNDIYGHDMGDRVLKRVADASMTIKRITDVAARIGGEEFALLLPETERTGAMQLAQRLRESIEAASTPFSHDQSVGVTASVGVASVSQESDDVEGILNFADEALYKAKDAGRNRVRFAERSNRPPPSSIGRE